MQLGRQPQPHRPRRRPFHAFSPTFGLSGSQTHDFLPSSSAPLAQERPPSILAEQQNSLAAIQFQPAPVEVGTALLSLGLRLQRPSLQAQSLLGGGSVFSLN